MKNRYFCYVILILLFLVSGYSLVHANWDQAFDDNVHKWIQQISEQDSCCSKWKNANWIAQSYGPNSRQWLITIYHHQAPIGYLIIGENESGGLELVEYSESPLDHGHAH